jgi:hypothetical protein
VESVRVRRFERADRLVAAAHLLRYRDDAQGPDNYRDAGEIRWLLDYAADGEDGYAAFLTRSGFQVPTRTIRGLVG